MLCKHITNVSACACAVCMTHTHTHTMGALTVAYTTIQPGKDAKFGDEWDASIKYTAGAMSASFATDEASATTLIAEYDLGGATAFAAMQNKQGTDSDLTTVGFNFSF